MIHQCERPELIVFGGLFARYGPAPQTATKCHNRAQQWRADRFCGHRTALAPVAIPAGPHGGCPKKRNHRLLLFARLLIRVQSPCLLSIAILSPSLPSL